MYMFRSLNSSFGIFQVYYMQTLNRSPDDISWIGSLQVFFLFFRGTIAGRLTDEGRFRIVFCFGSLLTCLGIFMANISTAYWQYLLAQGICTGVGNGFLFTPALAVVGTYFKQRRTLAYGLTATGTATGELIFPTMARQLLLIIELA
jgi:MFS family permease